LKLPALRWPAPGLRTQLLLLAIILLAVPWVGYRYVLEMERFLREGQERALITTARAVAMALNNRPALFEVSGAGPLGATDAGLYLGALPNAIVVDGVDSDWPTLTEASSEAPVAYVAATVSIHPRLGKHDRHLYLIAKVGDEHVLYHASAALDSGDRLELALVDPRGTFQRFVIAPTGPGKTVAWRVAGGDASFDAPVQEPRIEAFWRQAAQGYSVELRLPLTMVGPRFGFSAASVDEANRRETTSWAGPTATDNPAVLAPVIIPESQIDLVLQGMGRTQSRIWVVDRDRRVLAQTGTLKPQTEGQSTAAARTSFAARAWDRFEQATLRRVYAQVLRKPHEDFDDGPQDASSLLGAQIDEALKGSGVSRWRMTSDQRAVVLSAAQPIWVGDRPQGAVIVEETTNGILAVRSRALESLFTTAFVVLLVGSLALFFFATRLSTRIRRLRDQAERAVDQQGRVRGGIAGSKAGDEIGDLSRSFSTIVSRLGEYNAYLENMGGRLAHEIRTPIAVVRSSLDNLRLQPLPRDAQLYMDRAQEGLTRLARIVTSMTEATRLEQMLRHAERERFDLTQVVTGCVRGYRLAYPERAFDLQTPAEPVIVQGGPDFVAQMLDKLVANAVDFAIPGTPVVIDVQVDREHAVLSVSNDGPPLPAQMQGRLFESMISIRPERSDGEPHLGMGLYIVRLVAESLGGTVTAQNRGEGSGVRFSVSVPLAQTQ